MRQLKWHFSSCLWHVNMRLVILSVLFTVVLSVPWTLWQLNKWMDNILLCFPDLLTWWCSILTWTNWKMQDSTLTALPPLPRSLNQSFTKSRNVNVPLWPLLTVSFMFDLFFAVLTTHLIHWNGLSIHPLSLHIIFQNAVWIIRVIFLKYKYDCDTTQL